MAIQFHRVGIRGGVASCRRDPGADNAACKGCTAREGDVWERQNVRHRRRPCIYKAQLMGTCRDDAKLPARIGNEIARGVNPGIVIRFPSSSEPIPRLVFQVPQIFTSHNAGFSIGALGKKDRDEWMVGVREQERSTFGSGARAEARRRHQTS